MFPAGSGSNTCFKRGLMISRIRSQGAKGLLLFGYEDAFGGLMGAIDSWGNRMGIIFLVIICIICSGRGAGR